MSGGERPAAEASGAILVALNARYTHTALAVRSIARCAHRQGCDAAIAEFTINQEPDSILESLVEAGAKAYLFSTYIWNIERIVSLANPLRQLLPDALLLVGGPQVEHEAEAFLRRQPAFDAVLQGEGETTVPALLQALENGGNWRATPGLTWRSGTETTTNPPAVPPEMDALPFPYTDEELRWGRTFYYESMRGCPYRCSYCLSGGQGAPRAKSLALVKEELLRFIAAGVRQVKFVDRTFNCDAARALALWRFLAEHDNGRTNFHFELAGHLLNEETLVFLSGVRRGLFQFEIGVQSTHAETLRTIHRPGGQKTLFANIVRLRAAGRVHLHLDLIAGLPYEDYDSFVRSFDAVYALRPHQLQLGFLKVLSGSEMQQKTGEYGLCYRQDAPFEVLYTRWISYEQLCRLKRVARMVELYHNSGRFTFLCRYLSVRFASPFAFFDALADFCATRGYAQPPPGKKEQYELLGAFAAAQGLADERLQWLCRCDMAAHEKPRFTPTWVTVDGSRPQRERALAFYQREENLARYLPQYAALPPKQILRLAHIEVLPFCPRTDEKGEYVLLFNYEQRDVAGRAQVTPIVLPPLS